MTGKDPNEPSSELGLAVQAGRDAAYDNNNAVANSPALIAACKEASAKFRAAYAAALDIAYGTPERTKIDIYPARDKAALCLVFSHGGYWQRNSRDVFTMLVEGMATHGWSVAIPDYSLAPGVTLTEIVAEISLALDWLAANGPLHGIAGPVVLCGYGRRAPISPRSGFLIPL
jgi:acetyl esterase/lipase